MTKPTFDMDAAIAALKAGKGFTGKDGILTPLIKQLTREPRGHPTSSTNFFNPCATNYSGWQISLFEGTNMIRTLTWVVIAFGLQMFQAAAGEAERDSRAAIIEYLTYDFSVPIGTDDDRGELVYLEGAAVEPVPEECEDECAEVRPEVFLWESDPIIVVDAYSLQAIKNSTADTAVADVEFRRVASTRGKGSADDQRFFVKEPPTNETVHYQLKKIAGRWKVVNPPLPRVSHCRLLQLYKESLDRATQRLKQAHTKQEGASLRAIKNYESYVGLYTQQVNDLNALGVCKPM